MNTAGGVVPATRAGRWMGVVIPAVGTFLVVGFFAAHQLWSTGFFLPGFGGTIAALFYASILYEIIIVVAGAYGISQDRTTIAVMGGALLWTVTTIWLWIIFPFNFTHLADVVPAPLQFLLTWITPGVGKILWTLLTLGSIAFIPFGILQYAARHQQGRRGTEVQR